MAAITQVAIPQVDERAARRTLRDQIGRLERELMTACLDACPRIDPGPPMRSARGPHVLGLGELERVRDELAGRLSRVRGEIDAQLLQQAESRALVERMLADPPAPQVAAGEQRPARRAGLQALPRPPAPRPDRPAAGLVAREDLLGLPVSLRAVRAHHG